MPLYELKCHECDETKIEFCHRHEHKGQRQHNCPNGHGTMEYVIASTYAPLTYFRENNGRWIYNMGHEPVYITSNAQHKKEMKKHGVAPAPTGYGMPGSW